MNRKTKILSATLKERFLPWATVGLFALSSNWAAEAIPPIVRIWIAETIPATLRIWGALSWFRIIAITLFVGSMIALYLQRNTFFKPRTRHLINEEPEKRKHLLIFLSALREGISYRNGVPLDLTLAWKLVDDLVAMEQHKKETKSLWPWEMGLRAVQPHIGRLKTVTVVCSTSSILEVGLFLDILRNYKELNGVTLYVLYRGGDKVAEDFAKVVVDTYQGLEFESFDELSDTLWSYLKRHKLPEEEVMIDFTGGQKVTSVVAAALTFNRRIKAQYVQTNSPWRVMSYDVVHAFYDTGGLG